MLRALLALSLAICVTGAPLATALCQGACATRSAAAAESHTCHSEAPSSGPSLITVHHCGHTDALPGVDRPEQVTAAPAIMPAIAIVAPDNHVALPGVADVQVSPPPPPALLSQLRV